MLGAQLLKSRSLAIQQLIDVQKQLEAAAALPWKQLDPKTREEIGSLVDAWTIRNDELIVWLRDNP